MMEESSPGGEDGFRASFGALSLAGGSGDSTKNPLFESDPSDTDERRRSRDDQTSPGGIGRGRTEAPESHLRRVRAGGLLTKLPFDAKGAPRVRFFRVAASDRELQWGDPADAASPTLGSRLLLHEVQAVARGHATRALEAHARADPKRAGPPSECFSLVAESTAESCDLRGGDAGDAALWAGALETLCARARRAHAVERMHAPSPSAARAPASLGSSAPPPTPPSAPRPDAFAPARLPDYHAGGGSGADPRAGAEAATAFVPMASDPPLANEGHVALAVSPSEAEDERGVSPRAGGRSAVSRDATGNAREPVGAVSRFARRRSGKNPPPALADAPATRNDRVHEKRRGPNASSASARPLREKTDSADIDAFAAASSSTPRAPPTARAAASGGGEDLVEAFSRSRHGRAKELDALFARGVDPRARDANGLTLLHIAAQNNQRKTAKLVLKRTDYAVDPPSRDGVLNAQTNAGQTALHYAFAYGYHDLARWLVSLGADDGLVNVHGLSCYEGLDPDEPAREALSAPEMLEMARRKRRERRAEALRPGTSVGRDAGGYGVADDSRVSAPGSARGPRSDSAYGGSTYSGRSDAYSVSSAGSGESPSGWDPRPPSVAHRGAPAAPTPPPPVAPVASPAASLDAFAHHPGHAGYPHAAGFVPPGSPLLFGHAYPPHPGAAMHGPGMPGAAWSPASPYGGAVSGAPGLYGDSFHAGMGPSYAFPGADAVAAAHFAAHQRYMLATPYGNAGGSFFPAAGFPGGGARTDVFGPGGPGDSRSSARAAPPAPRPPSHDDSSNLDTSSDEGGRMIGVTKPTPEPMPKPEPRAGFQKARPDSETFSERKKPARRRAGEARAAAALPARRGGEGAADPDLDGRVAMRLAAMRRGGFHSSDSDTATSASEADLGYPNRAEHRAERVSRRSGEGGRLDATKNKQDAGGGEKTRERLAEEARGETREDAPKRLASVQTEAPDETPSRPPLLASSASLRADPELSSSGAGVAGAAPREERRRARAEERSVLPPRVASKTRLVLNAAGVGDASAVRDALLTGALGAGVADWPKTLRELCDARVFPSAVDLVAIRQAYVDADTGAVRKARADAAGAADRFFLALLEVRRPAEKARALATRETFAPVLDALVGDLDAVARAATRAAASERLDRLAEIALALGDILRKEAEGGEGGSPNAKKEDAETYARFAPGGWRAGALARLAAPSASTGNLLRHLAKTVAAKSPDLLRVGEELPEAPRAKGSLSRERAEAGTRRGERGDDDDASLALASARLADLAAAVDGAAREAEASATGKDAAYGKKFARSLELFLEQARAGLRRARAAEAQAREATEALSEKFGPAPPGAAPEETLEALFSFVRAFETAAAETAAAKRARERAKRPGG